MNDLTRPIIGIENRTAQEVFDIMCDRFRLAALPASDHADDLAVDRFADAMKAKLKWEREERGRGGWQNMSAEELSKILVDHLPKGDPVDVANLAMMLGINRQQIIMPASDHAGLASRVFYPVNNPSAWPDGFNQNISDLLREAATVIQTMQRERDELVRDRDVALREAQDKDIRYRTWREFYGALLAVPASSATPLEVRVHRQADIITDMQYRIKCLRQEIRRHIRRDHLDPPMKGYRIGQHVSKLHKLWREAEARAEAAEQQVRDMRAGLEFYRDGFKFTTNPRYGGLEWKPTEMLLDDCGNTARIALSTLNGAKP